MTQQKFNIYLTLIIVATVALCAGAFYVFSDDFDESWQENSAAESDIGLAEEDPALETFPYYDQRMRLEQDWKLIERRCDLHEMHAALKEAGVWEEEQAPQIITATQEARKPEPDEVDDAGEPATEYITQEEEF